MYASSLCRGLVTVPALTFSCQTLRARPRVRALLLARLQNALAALAQQGFQLLPAKVDTFVQEDPQYGYPVCGYSQDFRDPSDGSCLQLRSGLQLGSPEQASFLCGFVLQVLRPDPVPTHDLVSRVLDTEIERRVLCEVSSACSPGQPGWDQREGVSEVEDLLEHQGLLAVTPDTGRHDATRLAQRVVKTLQP